MLLFCFWYASTALCTSTYCPNFRRALAFCTRICHTTSATLLSLLSCRRLIHTSMAQNTAALPAPWDSSTQQMGELVILCTSPSMLAYLIWCAILYWARLLFWKLYTKLLNSSILATCLGKAEFDHVVKWQMITRLVS